MLKVREFREGDWSRVWQIMEPIVRAGETYPYAVDLTADQARNLWLDVTDVAYVAEDDDGELLGTYYIKPNQPTLGAHVANCGYMVAAEARGRGVATSMCQHSQSEAVRLGYRAMQFNLVVETNEASVYLWKKLDFNVVGRLPGAFSHPQQGYVDAFIMYKELVAQE
jgi:RimJ/RimL family protein N-acetyltransferase